MFHSSDPPRLVVNADIDTRDELVEFLSRVKKEVAAVLEAFDAKEQADG